MFQKPGVLHTYTWFFVVFLGESAHTSYSSFSTLNLEDVSWKKNMKHSMPNIQIAFSKRKKEQNTPTQLSPHPKKKIVHANHHFFQKNQPKTNPTWDQTTDPPWLHRIKPLDAISRGFRVSVLPRLRLRAPARSNPAVSSCRTSQVMGNGNWWRFQRVPEQMKRRSSKAPEIAIWKFHLTPNPNKTSMTLGSSC